MRRNNVLSRSMDELRSEYSYDIVSTPTNSIHNNSQTSNHSHHQNNNNNNNNNFINQNNNNYLINNNNVSNKNENGSPNSYNNFRKFSKPGYLPNNNISSNNSNRSFPNNKTRRLSQPCRPKRYSMDNLLTIENISFDENEEVYHQVSFCFIVFYYNAHFYYH